MYGYFSYCHYSQEFLSIRILQPNSGISSSVSTLVCQHGKSSLDTRSVFWVSFFIRVVLFYKVRPSNCTPKTSYSIAGLSICQQIKMVLWPVLSSRKEYQKKCY